MLGGAETVVLELSKELNSLGHENIIGILNNTKKPNSELADLAEQYDLQVRIFSCRGKMDFHTVKKIKQFIKENEIQIVHAHGYKARFYALLSGGNKPCITTCHLWDNYSLLQGFYIRLDKFWLNKFDRVVAVSDAIQNEILRAGVSANRVSVVENGIDTSRFNGHSRRETIREKVGLPAPKIVIGTVGRLVPQKGFDIFIQAAKKILQQTSNVIFVIVGDGPLMAVLKEQTAQLGLEKKVVFLGQRNDIPELLSALDIFVMSSLDEGTPMVLLEAMASQKPVVATKVGAIPVVVEDGKSGLLCEPDVLGLHEKITELLSDTKKAGRLARSARQRIVKAYSSRAMTEKYVQLYGQILN